MNKPFVILAVILLLPIAISLGVNIERDFPITTVNASDFWITNIGDLSGVNATQFENIGDDLNLNESWLSTFVSGIGDDIYCALVGCTMSGDINLDNNNIINGQHVNSTYVGATNITAQHLEVTTINASNITTENINVTQNSTIYLGGVPISSATSFDGSQVVTFGEAYVNATGYFGDGGFLDNISFENGTVTALAFNASQYYGGNFTGNNFTGENAFFDFYDWTAETPYLFFNGSFLEFNETAILSNNNFSSITLNGETITSWSDVNYTVGNDSVTIATPSFSGSYSIVLPETFSFEIAQIIVTPTNPSNNYEFALYEATGETIDANLIKHKGTWNIFKSYPIDNQVSVNFTNVVGTNDFSVTIKYFTNVN